MKLIDFYSQGIFTSLFATVFNSDETERQLIATWEDYRSYLPFVLVYKIYFGGHTKSIKCA